MLLRKFRTASAALVHAAALLAALCAAPAHALPSYARQTGMDCAGCHIGSFGPQLTPAGVMFKLGGYTDSDGQPGKLALSGMVLASLSHTSADQNPAPANLQANNNLRMDEASIFLAGKLTEHMGAFVQVTHNGIDHTTVLDQTDVRYVGSLELGGKDTLVGVSVNNNPGVQDPFNTMPVWSFPFASSPAGFGTGPVSSLINGGVEGRVVGASAYTLYDKSIYAELGSYRSMSPATQRRLGLGEDLQRLGGNTYWRMAWMKDQKSQAFHVGMFGWNAALAPDRTVSGPSDHYRDVGVDASYQFLGTRQHIATVNGSYVQEHKTAGATGSVVLLNESRLNASYHFNQTWGGSVGVFSTHGTDPTAATNGQLLQLDWTPWGKESASTPQPFEWAHLRLGAQYWRYAKFGGDTTLAKDHNTLYLFAWTSF